MTTTFLATAQPDHFTAFHFSQAYDGVSGLFDFSFSDPIEPYNGFYEEFNSSPQATSLLSQLSPQFLAIAALSNFADSFARFTIEFFDSTVVDYSFSTASVFVDLEQLVQQGGFAQGDVLTNVSEITGSAFDDVIRGSNPSDYPPDTVPFFVNGHIIQENLFYTLNNPGNNVLNGGNGNDVLEGRGGADLLNGGSGFDFASYESSPAAVTVRLPGVGSDSQTAIATGGDATGDTFSSIEGLIGSKFADHLTGNSLNNVLAGGLGNDVLDGKGGIDTADYSRDHFFDIGDTPDKVVVQLGLNGANGTAAEFKASISNFPTITYNQVSTDTLISIENVTGTAGPDQIIGNEQDNVLDGRDGNDFLDGGLGNDTLIGGLGNDTASYQSHNSLTGEFGTISLGLNGADGLAQYSVLITLPGFPFPVPVVVETDTLRGIENINGSNLNETINGNEQNNVLDGGLGNDTINGRGGNDTVSYVSHDNIGTLFAESDTISLGLNGADGSYTRGGLVSNLGHLSFQVVETDVLRDIDNVTGSNHSETINGNEQDNVLAGRGGNDTINGGAGNDTYDFRGSALGSDRYFDSSGTDKILIDSFSEIKGSAQVGNDLQITLTAGNITIVNHFAGDPIESLVDAQGHTLVLATGLTGGNLPGIISGSDADDTMDGRGGDDYLFGNGGNDHLLGGADNDVLDGGDGNDILAGGSGNDILTGGKGNDTFVFAPVESDGLPGGNDVITDFVSGQDRIDLTAFNTTLDALLGAQGSAALNDSMGAYKSSGHSDNGNGPPSQPPSPITIQTVGDDTVLSYNGGSIDIVGVQHLHASDFIV
jgi:Ca2+-binding RTX toxin-like protein